jgi:hypothetical protein
MSLHQIEREKLTTFLEEVIPSLRDPDKVTHNCPHCRRPVAYPLIVDREHVKVMEELISAANKYLRRTGVIDVMLSEILATCLIEKVRQNGTDNGGSGEG